MSPTPSTRRRFLRIASAGAAGLAWPVDGQPAPGVSFTFAVANDLHYRDERCGAWLKRVANHLYALQPQPAFVVLAGDLSEDGTAEQIGAVRTIFARLPMPVHALIGNHDHTESGDRSAYESVYGTAANYRFDHGGCQFLVLDSTQGRSVYRTKIPATTFQWVEAARPALSRARPTIVLTHFPLGRNWLRPLNARELIGRFRDQQLLATFSGHWHGLTEAQEGAVHLSTGRCCSWWRPNHDHSDEKGYTLATVTSRREAAGTIWAVEHRFVAVSPV